MSTDWIGPATLIMLWAIGAVLVWTLVGVIVISAWAQVRIGIRQRRIAAGLPEREDEK